MFTRRSFLIGLGGLVTSAFVARAKAHVLDTGEPLLIRPAQVQQQLYLYEGYDADGGNDGFRYRASLGPDDGEPPPPLTWRERLTDEGYRFDTPADLERVLRERGLQPTELEQSMPEGAWEEYWQYDASPQARAYKLLKALQFDCDPSTPGRKAGALAFTDWGGHPGSCARWVDVKDDLSVSILQARITERGLPIKMVLQTLG